MLGLDYRGAGKRMELFYSRKWLVRKSVTYPNQFAAIQ